MSELSRRIFLKYLCLLSCLGFSSIANSQVKLDPIVIEPGRKQIRIAVESNDPLAVEICRQGFALHGGFENAEKSGADWVLSLEVRDASIAYELRSPAGAVRDRGTVNGGASNSALLLLMDSLVENLTGSPGFFEGKLSFIAEASGAAEIYVSDILFRDTKRVTRFGSNVVSPRWSSDGKRLIYTSYARTGFPDIVVQDLEKKTLRTVADYRGVNLGGSFSPDGRFIAFVASSSGSPEIYIARPDGSGARRQTWTKGLAATPSWSPDSKQLVFVSDDWGGPQLILLDPAKKSNTRIRTGMGGYNVEPDWNPKNPDLIAFTTRVAGAFQIALYSFSKGESVQLTKENGSCVEPTWLSDGRHIVFTYRHNKTKQLKILDSQTGRIAQLHAPGLKPAYQADYVNPSRR